MDLFFGLILSAGFALTLVYGVEYVKCCWYLDHEYKEEKKHTYLAVRDIDCEPHYFDKFDNAVKYVWDPMSKELFYDKDRTSIDHNELYDSFIKGSSDNRWDLNANPEWPDKYKNLGGFVEYIEID